MEKEKRILFCIDSIVGGGAEQILQNTVNELAKDSSIKVTVQLLRDKNFPKMNPAIKKRTFMRNGRFCRGIIRFLPARVLHWLVIKGKYDIEVAFLEGAATKVISGCHKSNTRTIAWVHTDMEKYPWSQRSYRNHKEEENAYKAFNKVFAVSTDVKRVFEKKFGIEACFAQNIIDDRRIVEMSRRYSAYSDDKLHLVSVGSIRPVKGYDRLIGVYQTLKKLGVSCVHYFLGDGQDFEKLAREIKEAGLEEHMILLGRIENPYPWIKDADLLVCSSYAEGYSSVVSEAIILGTPVLTTDCAGMRDILGESEYGLIVDNTDEALKTGMIDVLTHREKLLRYKDLAKKRSSIFQLDEAVRQLKKALEL